MSTAEPRCGQPAVSSGTMTRTGASVARWMSSPTVTPYAPDGGPNHDRHEALLEQYRALGDALTKRVPPTTPEGVRTLAEVSLLPAPRRSNDTCGWRVREA